MDNLRSKNVTQSVLRGFNPNWVAVFMVVQIGTTLVLVLSHLVQTEVITDEIYSVLFQRVLLFAIELIRLLWF